MTEGLEPRPSVELSDARIAAALADPGVRHWVKDALISVRDRDPVDAASDAALLARLLGDRADALLAELARGRGSRRM